MSLPSSAIFLKDDKIVGVGFCNIGWFVRLDGLLGCIYDGWMNAVAHFTPIDPKSEWYERSQKQREHDSKYFSTKEELVNFDHVLVYNFLIPKDFAESVHSGERTKEQFADEVNQFILNNEEEKALHEKIFKDE